MIESILFNDQKPLKSQQTIVLVLRHFKYYFKPVTEYSNDQFYCYIRRQEETPFKNWFYNCFKWAGAKEPKEKYFDCPLSICYCSCINTASDELIVFSQEDVSNIIYDVPENYIGEDVL